MNGFLFDCPEEKKIRVLIDTDAACEADDPFAIVQALLSPKAIVRGIIAEHFGAPDSMEQSFAEIRTILDCMGREDVPAFRGQEARLQEMAGIREEDLSDGARAIIDEAMKDDPHPLFVLCQGVITNVAAAMSVRPEIKDHMTVIWIGTHGEAPAEAPFPEFNAGNDIKAANLVLQSGGDIWVVPSGVYSTVHIGIAEIQRRIRPCGKIGEHLFQNLVEFSRSGRAFWTKGESWCLGDSPAIALALDPDCGRYKTVPAPEIREDTSSAEGGAGGPVVRMYTEVDARYILEDLIAKLEISSGR